MSCCHLVTEDTIRARAGLSKNLQATEGEWVVSLEDATREARKHLGAACTDDLCARVEADGLLTDTNRTDIAAAQALARPAGSAWLAAWVAIGLGDLTTAATQRTAAIAAYGAAIAATGWAVSYAPTTALYSANQTAALADYTLAVGADAEALKRLKAAADYMGAVELLPLRAQDLELRKRLAGPVAHTFAVYYSQNRRYFERPAGQMAGNGRDVVGRTLTDMVGERDNALRKRMQEAWTEFDAWYQAWPKRECALEACGECTDCGKNCGGCSDTRLVSALPPNGNVGDQLVKTGPADNEVGWAAPGGGGGGGATNITIARTPTQVTVESSSGTDGVIPAADGTNAGVMSAADKTRLDTTITFEQAAGLAIALG